MTLASDTKISRADLVAYVGKKGRKQVKKSVDNVEGAVASTYHHQSADVLPKKTRRAIRVKARLQAAEALTVETRDVLTVEPVAIASSVETIASGTLLSPVTGPLAKLVDNGDELIVLERIIEGTGGAEPAAPLQAGTPSEIVSFRDGMGAGEHLYLTACHLVAAAELLAIALWRKAKELT